MPFAHEKASKNCWMQLHHDRNFMIHARHEQPCAMVKDDRCFMIIHPILGIKTLFGYIDPY